VSPFSRLQHSAHLSLVPGTDGGFTYRSDAGYETGYDTGHDTGHDAGYDYYDDDTAYGTDAPAEQTPTSFWADTTDAGQAAWRLDALCAETDPEAFFPEKGGSTREAKRVCTGCSVRTECLEFALANDERFGIWGGLSERERRRVRLERRDRLSA
jgi:WhiB family redox-sensing transcriptional regulator